MYPLHVLQVSTSPKFHRFALRFQVTGRFEKSALNDPNMTLNTTSSNVASICAILRKCTKWPQNDLEPYKVNVPQYMYYWCPWVPHFSPFHFTASHFRDAGQVHWMTPKCPWILQCQMYPIYVLLLFMSPTFHFVSLYDQPFSTYRPFWDKCTHDPKITLHPTR